MAAESVDIEVLGITTETGGDSQSDLSVVESKPQKELELVADEDGECARVVLKDVETDSSEESTTGQDGVGGMTDEGESGAADQKTEGVKSDCESPALEDEEQEECGFCLFMKGGPCGERFSIWQNCVDRAEKSGEDIVEKCAQTTSLLKVCMEMNLEYYGPVLEAEKAMEEVAAQDENQGADSPAKPAESGENEEKQDANSEGSGKVVEIVTVTAVDGEVTEVVDVVAEAKN